MKSILKASEVIDPPRESDTIRLWENYRDQAVLWRAIALLQIPVTLCLAVFSMWLYGTSNPVINVPDRPLPGIYQANQIPDPIFIEAATDFINLIATYQSAVARRQFDRAQEMLQEPFLTRFKEELIAGDLRAIEATSRTQLFFPDPLRTTIERRGTDVLVTLTGDRLRIVAGKHLPNQQTRYQIVLTTIPKNALNPYGIVVKGLGIEDITVR